MYFNVGLHAIFMHVVIFYLDKLTVWYKFVKDRCLRGFMWKELKILDFWSQSDDHSHSNSYDHSHSNFVQLW